MNKHVFALLLSFGIGANAFGETQSAAIENFSDSVVVQNRPEECRADGYEAKAIEAFSFSQAVQDRLEEFRTRGFETKDAPVAVRVSGFYRAYGSHASSVLVVQGVQDRDSAYWTANHIAAVVNFNAYGDVSSVNIVNIPVLAP